MTSSAASAPPTQDSSSSPAATEARQQLAEALCRTIAGIHRRGWCEGTGGNFSAVLQREPLRLLMAASGVDKGAVQPEGLIEVDGEGGVSRGKGRASAETLLHLEIVRQCDAGAVLHTHSPTATQLSRRHGPEHEEEATVLKIEGYEMLKGLEGISSHQQSIAIPVMGNDQDIARLAARARAVLPQAPHGLLVSGHGLYAWGSDLAQARRHLEVLEFLLEQMWRELLLEVRGLGGPC